MMVAPLSLIVSAFAPVRDVRRTLTPQLRMRWRRNVAAADRSGRRTQSTRRLVPRAGVRQPRSRSARLRRSARAWRVSSPRSSNCARAASSLAYHDRSDGGLFVDAAEMAFAGRCGVERRPGRRCRLESRRRCSAKSSARCCRSRTADAQAVRASARTSRPRALHVGTIGRVTSADRVVIRAGGRVVLDETRTALRRAWSETSFRMVELRDNPQCAREQFAAAVEPNDPGLNVRLTFQPQEDIAAPFIAKGARPKVAILREQGVNSHVEMAAAFHRAGFDAVRRAHDRPVRASLQPR